MPYSATPHLNFPPFLVEYITEFHQDVMIDWTNQIDEDRIYLPENHNFWTRERRSPEEAETGFIKEVIDEIFEKPADDNEEAIGDPAESTAIGEKVLPFRLQK